MDFRNPNAPAIATEFVGTSITSGGDGVDQTPRMKDVLAENPFVKFQSSQRGYVSCAVTKEAWHADYQVLDYVSRPGAPRKTRASFKVTSGRPGAERL